MPQSQKQIKSLGGRSKNNVKLTDKVINKFQKYYGLTRHQDNVDEMYTERKNLIESKRSWPMRYSFAANEIIYLIQ